MSSKLSRTILFTFFALALLAVAPAFAEPAPAGGCGAPALDLFAPVTAAPQVTPASQVTAPALPDFMATTFRGMCRCSCTWIPNCNTSADCGGAACLKSITCC